MTIKYMVSIGNGDLLFFDADRKLLPAVEPVIGHIRERLAVRAPEQGVDTRGYEWDDVLKDYNLEERNNALVYEAKNQVSVGTAPDSYEQYWGVGNKVGPHDVFPSCAALGGGGAVAAADASSFL